LISQVALGNGSGKQADRLSVTLGERSRWSGGRDDCRGL